MPNDPSANNREHRVPVHDTLFFVVGIVCVITCIVVLFPLCRILPPFSVFGILTSAQKTEAVRWCIFPCLVCGIIVLLHQLTDRAVRLPISVLICVFLFALFPLGAMAILQNLNTFHTACAVSAAGIALTSHTAAVMTRALLRSAHTGGRFPGILRIRPAVRMITAILMLPLFLILFILSVLYRPLLLWGIAVICVLPHSLLCALFRAVLPRNARFLFAAMLCGSAAFPVFFCLFPFWNAIPACAAGAVLSLCGIVCTVMAIVKKEIRWEDF